MTADQLRDRIAAALRVAAKDCDGTCGLAETDCFEEHPIQVSVIHFDQIAGVYGYIDALAAVAATAVQPEVDRLQAEIDRRDAAIGQIRGTCVLLYCDPDEDNNPIPARAGRDGRRDPRTARLPPRQPVRVRHRDPPRPLSVLPHPHRPGVLMPDSPAQIAYRSYGNTTGNRNFLGQPMPTWNDLPHTIQLAWQNAVADAIVASAIAPPAIDIYPTGLLADLKQWANNPDRRGAWRRLRYDVRIHGLRHVCNRNWSSLRRWVANGYLAEPAEWPDGLTRCGTGWTRGRALHDLERRTAALAVARALRGEVTE